MPARSNILQRLVAEIHSQLPGWSVEESRSLIDKFTGEPREVDVVAQTIIGGYAMVLSIEVQDRDRGADTPWVESMLKKHESLPTSKLVLWAGGGFSKPAVEKARYHNVECIDLTASDAPPWATFARDIANGFLQWVTPEYASPCMDVVLQDGSATRWQDEEVALLRYGNGSEWPTIAVVNYLKLQPQIEQVLLDRTPEGFANFHMSYSDPTCLVLHKDGRIGRLLRLLVGLRSESRTVRIDLRSAVHDGVATTLAEGDVGKGMVQVVVRETPEGRSTTARFKLKEQRPRKVKSFRAESAKPRGKKK